LNNLIETCKDGEKGFREAAESIRYAYHQVLFKEYARQRGQFASQLQVQVRLLGADPDRKGSVAGSIHRGWLNLKAAIAHKNDDAIIAECERGEEAALKNYQVIRETYARIQAMEKGKDTP
jgi:uncharacterized protein (TIGR02284 family)